MTYSPILHPTPPLDYIAAFAASLHDLPPAGRVEAIETEMKQAGGCWIEEDPYPRLAIDGTCEISLYNVVGRGRDVAAAAENWMKNARALMERCA